MKILCLVILTILATCLAGPLSAQNINPSTVISSQNFKLKTNELANSFHILDQISESLPEFFQIPEYKELLKEKFTHDLDLLSSYKKLRIKYQKLPRGFEGDYETNSGLFAPNIDEIDDPICDAFFSRSSLKQALQLLQGKLSNDEINLIKNIFTVFEKDLGSINYETSRTLQKNSEALNHNLNQALIEKHFYKIRKFYNSPIRKFNSILLLQSPSIGNFSGNSYGDHLIIRIPNLEVKDLDTLKMMSSVIIHEAVHHISASAPASQKRVLSDIFLTQVNNIREDHFLMSFEEPLVMATQIVFVKNVYPEIDPKILKGWFNHPLAQKFSAFLEEYLNQDKSIDGKFMKKCAVEYIKLHENI